MQLEHITNITANTPKANVGLLLLFLFLLLFQNYLLSSRLVKAIFCLLVLSKQCLHKYDSLLRDKDQLKYRSIVIEDEEYVGAIKNMST